MHPFWDSLALALNVQEVAALPALFAAESLQIELTAEVCHCVTWKPVWRAEVGGGEGGEMELPHPSSSGEFRKQLHGLF